MRHADGVHAPSVCPRLFGSAKRHQLNAQRRKRLLYWVDQSKGATIVAHGSDRWRRPRPIVYRGMDLIAARARDAAVVELRPELARARGCPAGRYRLRIDDAVGGSGVLAVLAHGVLLERRGILRYLGTADRRAPRWLMAWGSRYKVYMPRKASATRRAPPRRPKPKPKRKRRHP